MSELAREPLSFGLSLPNRAVLFGTPVEALFDTAQLADESGLIDSVWVGDNFLSKPRLEAVVLLSGLAMRTRRVKLGTVCLASFPLRNPVVFGLQWASLDLMAGGRTILVVCNGGPARFGPKYAAELLATGVHTDERMGRVEEGIEVLRRIWRDDEVNFQGKYYTLEGVTALPRPAQAHVPIAIAINPALDATPRTVERALRRVARISDGWQTDGLPPETFRERWAQILDYARECGRESAVTHNSLHLMVNLNDNPDVAWEESITFLDRYYSFASNLGPILREKLNHWVAYGSPEQVIAKIQSFIDAGLTTPILRFCSPDQTGQLQRCLRDVLPAFSDQIVAAKSRFSHP